MAQDDLGPLYTPTALVFASRYVTALELGRVAFWPKPVSLFGLFTLTMLASVHLVLTMSSDPSATPG